MADWGFKVSQAGFDVKTCADKDLIMSSSFNALKVKTVGSGSSTTVAHGLGYIPIVFTTQTVGGKQTIIGDDPQTTVDSTNVTLGGSTTKYLIIYQQGI